MEDYDLTNGSISKLIKKIAIPSGIGFLFNTLFNVVDTFYAGKLSTDALAGLTISFPIFFIIIAVSSGLGSGTTALSAISLGEKNIKEVHKLSYNALFTGIVLSIIIIFLAPFLTTFLFNLSGSEGNSMKLGMDYTKTIFYGTGFFILNSILNGILNAQGDTKSYRNFLITGFFLNLILDPLLIYGWFNIPKLGTMGVALATIIVQMLGTIYLIYKVIKSPIINWIEFKKSSVSITTIKNLFKQSIPASLNMATIAIGVFVINYFILYFASPSTIAGYGAAVRVEQLALLPAFGLNIAVLTIVGQNFGAKKYDRIFKVKKLAMIISIGMMVVGAIIIFPLAPLLIKLFNDDPEVIKAGATYLRIEVIAFPSYVILGTITSTLQGIKKPNFSVYIGLYRQIFLPIILFYILGTYLDLGVLGVWWGIVLINWSAVFITILYGEKQFRKLKLNN